MLVMGVRNIVAECDSKYRWLGGAFERKEGEREVGWRLYRVGYVWRGRRGNTAAGRGRGLNDWLRCVCGTMMHLR